MYSSSCFIQIVEARIKMYIFLVVPKMPETSFVFCFFIVNCFTILLHFRVHYKHSHLKFVKKKKEEEASAQRQQWPLQPGVYKKTRPRVSGGATDWSPCKESDQLSNELLPSLSLFLRLSHFPPPDINNL